MLSYCPIAIAAIFKKVEWKPIPHTSKVTIDQIEKAKALVAKKLALAEAGEELNDDDEE